LTDFWRLISPLSVLKKAPRTVEQSPYPGCIPPPRVLKPAAQVNMDHIPTPKGFRQSPPHTPVFTPVNQGLEQIPIRYLITPLFERQGLY
jgi:hypothetical protein